MKSIDYSWVIGLVVLVALVFLWKPILGVFRSVSDKATNKDAYERGKAAYRRVLAR